MTMYNRTLQVRLTEREKLVVLNRMRREGYRNLSAWLRFKLAQWKDETMEDKIEAIHRFLIKEKHDKRKR